MITVRMPIRSSQLLAMANSRYALWDVLFANDDPVPDFLHRLPEGLFELARFAAGFPGGMGVGVAGFGGAASWFLLLLATMNFSQVVLY
jgi:hypothetical protein